MFELIFIVIVKKLLLCEFYFYLKFKTSEFKKIWIFIEMLKSHQFRTDFLNTPCRLNPYKGESNKEHKESYVQSFFVCWTDFERRQPWLKVQFNYSRILSLPPKHLYNICVISIKNSWIFLNILTQCAQIGCK